MEIPSPNPSDVRLLRIDVCSDTPVDHPEVATLLRAGWTLKQATPRLVEGEGVQWFIVLTRPDDASNGLSPAD